MSDSMRAGKPNRSRSGKRTGGANVTQSKKPRKSNRRDYTIKAQSAEGLEKTKSKTSADSRPVERYTRDGRSGSSSNGKSHTNRPRSSSEGENLHSRSNVSSSASSRGQRPGTRSAGVAGQLRRGATNPDRDIRSDGNPSAHIHNRKGKSVACRDVMSVFVQVWQLLFDDLCPDAAAYFSASIESDGVADTISWLNSVSQMLINNEPGSIMDAEFLNVLSQYPLKDQLQVLRFGKRFGTSDWSGDDEKRILTSFLSRNNRCKMLDRHELPTWLRLIMNEVKADLFSKSYDALGVTSFNQLVPPRSFEWDWKHFPHGTTAEGFRNEFEKWLSLSASYDLIDPMLAQGISHHEHELDYTSTSNLCFVAKDYRGPRLIMEEDLEVTLRQTPVCEAMMRVIDTVSTSPFCPAGRITLDDQTRNQELAIAGASSKYYATIDLSDASDCISTRLLYDALPTDVATAITSSRSQFVNLTDGRTVPLYIPCTMGSRNTVPGQSLVYWVCVMTSVEIGVRYNLWSYDIVADISVYNDDIIVPSIMYDIVTAVLTKVGLVVNFDKSYTDAHPFRESCGVDAYEDLIVTTSYWPRKNVELSGEYLPSLCSLQNKLFTYPARRASDFVAECVLAIAANTPVRLPGEKITCLYGNKSNYQVIPYATAVQGCPSAPNGIGLMSTFELRQTYDNRLVTCDSLIDGHYVTPQHVQQLAELYEYEYWLLYGSEYYDDLCEHLHVTMPIKRRKHLVPQGYTARRAYSSIADPTALRAAQRESSLRQARAALFNARQAKKRKKERDLKG